MRSEPRTFLEMVAHVADRLEQELEVPRLEAATRASDAVGQLIDARWVVPCGKDEDDEVLYRPATRLIVTRRK